MSPDAFLTGVSRRSYRFQSFTIQAVWNQIGGVYVFCRAPRTLLDGWRPLYIGQTHSFQERLSRHEQWPSASMLGADTVLAIVADRADLRDFIEADLIAAYQPRLNVQLKRGLSQI